MFEELRRRDQDKSESDRLKALVRSSGAQVATDDESRAAAALATFQRDIKMLYVGGSLGATRYSGTSRRRASKCLANSFLLAA